MKKLIQQFIAMLGGSSAYAGNTEVYTPNAKGDEFIVTRNVRTLFINDPRKGESVESIEAAVYNKFGHDLPFTLKTN